MPTIVQKYGGSSVADGDRLLGIARHVVARHKRGERLVVVVSAMGKTTDQLIAQARALCADPPRRELDMLVTAGERISMALLSMAISACGGEAISFTGSQSGIITDEAHQGARILEVKPQRIEAELDAGRVVIVAGYQGVSRSREVTTLGRGGSDTSAVALAAALHADACEIYSDVDGVYSADPRVCPQAQLLAALPYTVMQQMACAGARVLNADAVAFAERAGITILARRTGDASGRQTRIAMDVPVPVGVTAVVGTALVSCLDAPLAQIPADFWDHISKLGARAMGLGTACLWLDRTGIPGGDPAPLRAAAAAWGLAITEVGVVTLVGTRLLDATAQPLATLLHALNMPARGFVGTATALSVATAPEHVDTVVRACHAQFATTPALSA